MKKYWKVYRYDYKSLNATLGSTYDDDFFNKTIGHFNYIYITQQDNKVWGFMPPTRTLVNFTPIKIEDSSIWLNDRDYIFQGTINVRKEKILKLFDYGT